MVVVLITLSFISGFLMKMTDLMVEHELCANRILSILSGIAYGLSLAFLLRTTCEVLPTYVAILIAVLICGKVDCYEHGLATGIITLNLLLHGITISRKELFLILMFAIAGIIDEIGNDLVDRGVIKGAVAKVFLYRLVLEVTVLLYSIVAHDYVQWVFLASLDGGYVCCSWVMHHVYVRRQSYH
ncbi:MAG: hypothetical protein DRZ82_05320 [Thermoprotei archaeon]|nr:MAG: hypothetical protein DRZ82_05320 [Thermoprotei archaeon]